jgi:carbamoyltransferase
MKILGLHFGHDASIAVLDEGRVVSYLEKERTSRTKHAIGIDLRDVQSALDRCAIGIDEIDFVSVSSTQGIDYVFFDPNELSFELTDTQIIPSNYYPIFKEMGIEFKKYYPDFYIKKSRFFEEHGELLGRNDWVAAGMRHYSKCNIETMAAHPGIEGYINTPAWDIGDYLTSKKMNLLPFLGSTFETGFNLPITATVAGRKIPGAMFSHHFAHAAYAYYSSQAKSALVISIDGGIPDGIHYCSGMVYYGDGDRLYPLYPHWLNIGFLYSQAGTRLLGFDIMSSPGKLMGLSSYGQPAFYSDRFAESLIEQRRRLEVQSSADMLELFVDWVHTAAEGKGMDLGSLGDPARVLETAPTAVAASVQRIFEVAVHRTVETACEILNGEGLFPEQLVITGGCALNCPANSALSRDFGFRTVFVPPGSCDSGLAIGSAQALYHSVLKNQRAELVYPHGPAYLGQRFSRAQIEAALEKYAGRISASDHGDEAPRRVAEALVAGKFVGWFEGGSEIGPRALGHRSILADARVGSNWRAVNQIKGREAWRPFAPIVRAERMKDWFFGAPADSPYMLFTHYVASPALPATTHVDRTARAQSVERSAGAIYRVLEEFETLTGVPVLMNTSFNGPGEPIVESPEDALNCFLARGLDLLAMEGFIVRPK